MKNPGNWSQVETIFHAALERSAEERGRVSCRSLGDDAELRRKIQSPIACESETQGFTQRAAV